MGGFTDVSLERCEADGQTKWKTNKQTLKIQVWYPEEEVEGARQEERKQIFNN